jgi:hypothetical protein
MAITISGSGITSANIADGTIVSNDISASANIPASKLTGVGATKASSNPAVDTNGSLGDQWINTTTGELFILKDATTDANVWKGQDGSNVTPVNDGFETVLYTGTGSTLTISMANITTGVDFVWTKPRTGYQNHNLHDSIRGNLRFYTNNNSAETAANSIVYDSADFEIGGAQSDTNTSGGTYVAWCASLPTDNSGSTTGGNGSAKTYTNKSNGWMSVTTFQGNGATQHGIPHHLDAAPQFLWVKHRGSTGNHQAYSATIGNTKVFNVNSTAAPEVSSSRWDNTTPTATEVKLGTDWEVNDNNQNFVMYAFTSVTDKCKVGSFTGDGGANTLVDVGFEPGWVLIRRMDGTGLGVILDDKRGSSTHLYTNDNGGDDTSSNYTKDFTTAGFKQGATENSNFNANGASYMYMAIAK